MKLHRALMSVVLAVCFALRTAYAQAPPLDNATRAEVIEALLRQLTDYYVFPEVANQVGVAVRAKQRNGRYDEVTDVTVFANMLTADLLDTSRDLHLGVMVSDTPRPPARLFTQPSSEEKAERLKVMVARNYGVGKVDILEGNIGYLDLRGFDRVADAAPAITAVMIRLADTAALIIDVRNNGGGDPAGVSFLSSYLFDERTHLNDLYSRQGLRTEQFWTNPRVQGKHFGQQKAIYVLTGPLTFSAGEEFCYNLQQLKRATLVGGTTRGGANPGHTRALNAYFSAFIPSGRAINPISKTNWEGRGVTPDIAVPVEQALAVAHKLALSKLTASSTTAGQPALTAVAQ